MAHTHHHGRRHNPRAENNRPWHEQMTTPGSWVREMMNQPKRAKNRRLARKVLRGADPEGMAWPTGNRRPHIYYW